MGNPVSDFIDNIENGIKNILVSGITNEFEFISDVINSNFKGTAGSTSLTHTLLTQHPYNFTGGSGSTGGGFAGDTWTAIKGMCDTAVVPIATLILTVIIATDLINQIVSGNNMKEFDDSLFMKWLLKSVCGILLVSHTYDIASGLYSIGTGVAGTALSTLLGTGAELSEGTLSTFKTQLQSCEIASLILIFLICLLVLLMALAMTMVIIAVLVSRMMEAFMYLGVAPIPMATMMNSSWSGMGKTWIKNVLALSFQGLFIIIALAIFKTIYDSVIVSICKPSASGVSDLKIITKCATLAGYSLVLIMTMLRSGQISKSIFSGS